MLIFCRPKPKKASVKVPSRFSSSHLNLSTTQPLNVIDERFFVVDLARDCRRPDRIFASQLDRASPHRRSALQAESARQLLEDVHDCDPARRDPGVAGLFLETNP